MNPEGKSVVQWDPIEEMWRVDVAPYATVWTESESLADLVALRLEPNRPVTRR